jgi:hypothetical protein
MSEHDYSSLDEWIVPKPQEDAMRTHRFGRKLKLPATIAIKHQLRMLMRKDALKNAEAAASIESIPGQQRDETRPLSQPQKTVISA